jgi:NADH:ubiquinone oxidoreductase subunit K
MVYQQVVEISDNFIIESMVAHVLVFFLGVQLFVTLDLFRFILVSEVIYLLESLLFLNAALLVDDIEGQFVVLVILTIAAVESTFGLAVIIYTYNLEGNVKIVEGKKN